MLPSPMFGYLLSEFVVGLIQHGAFVFGSGLFTVYVDSGTDLTVLFGPIMKISLLNKIYLLFKYWGHGTPF